MKKILIHAKGAANNSLFNPNERDAYNDPLIYLRERLHLMGYELTTSDDNSLDDCVRVIFFDSPSVRPYKGAKGIAKFLRDRLQYKIKFRDLYSECVEKGIVDKTALFLWEAPAVDSNNWDLGLHRLFPTILTWHSAYASEKKYHKIFWPQTRLFPQLPVIEFNDKKLLTNISMNKGSSHPRELYSARLESIRYFENNCEDDFDLYGVGWNRPASFLQKIFPSTVEKHSAYRGVVKNKWDVLPYYRFCLCYENIQGEPGWVTEKIFDAMRAGCVPVYWGAPDISDFVDSSAFIDRRNFASNEELAAYLLSVGEKQYNEFQDAIKKYLNSDRFARFLPPAFADTVITALAL